VHIIDQIKELLAAGETYQVNFTFPLRAPFSSDPWQLFLGLAQDTPTGHAAFVGMERHSICSVSPELFFTLEGGHLLSRPMKGTAARGRTLAEDIARSEWLRESGKNRAENIMIVDMVRNDMGRIADVGSVRVSRLFEVERFSTLWQMTSTVESTTSASIADILTALFPCASITGAPKRRTMQIIASLESAPRRIYTGCIGFIAPERKAKFSVAIRTVLIDHEKREAEYGVGGGIVWESEPAEEYAECQTKGRVLTEQRPEFSLLETMLWTPGEGYFLLEHHLKRLHDSAVYFGFSLDLERADREIATLAATFPSVPHKVRLLAARDGGIACEASPISDESGSQGLRLRLAPNPVDSSNPFLFHKTTYRAVYEEARAACPECDDVLLWNEKGEITETTIFNVFVPVEGDIFTPPVECGLLPGVFRAWMLEQGTAREHVLTAEDLKRAGVFYVGNSVRKLRKARFL
jgi:para-aminobenzoate synthetase/4-amino-4-deoxychorismate lyase